MIGQLEAKLTGLQKQLNETKGGFQSHLVEQQENAEADQVAKEIIPAKPYLWRDWNIVSGQNSLFVYSDYVVLEYPIESTGKFWFIVNGKTWTVSLGSVYSGEHARHILLEGLQDARKQVRPGVQSQQILSTPGPSKLIYGKWSMTCRNDGRLIIKNSDSKDITTLTREWRHGFDFITSDGQVRSFI